VKKFLFGALVVLGAIALSWIVVCGLIKLISLCFGFDFTWALGTGIWLVMFLLNAVFGNKNKK
jgi:hypothetical protein